MSRDTAAAPGTPTSHWPAVAAVMGSYIALCLGTSFAKTLFPVLGAQGTSALRVGLSAVVLCLFWRPWRWRLTRADLVVLARYGIALGVMNLCFYMAIARVPFGIAVAIEFTGPLAVALWTSRRPLDALWVLLAATGLALLLPWQGHADALDPVGVAYALGAALCWGAYIIFGKRAQHLVVGQSVPLGLLFAAAVVVPVGAWHAGTALLQPTWLAAGVAVAIASSAVPMSLEMYALRRLPRETFGVLTSLEPAVAAFSGIVFLHEHLSGLQWLAIGCVMLASVGSVASIPASVRQAATSQP